MDPDFVLNSLMASLKEIWGTFQRGARVSKSPHEAFRLHSSPFHLGLSVGARYDFDALNTSNPQYRKLDQLSEATTLLTLLIFSCFSVYRVFLSDSFAVHETEDVSSDMGLIQQHQDRTVRSRRAST
jgi:hypothetical protein